jgi:hypothetical protein
VAPPPPVVLLEPISKAIFSVILNEVKDLKLLKILALRFITARAIKSTLFNPPFLKGGRGDFIINT